MSDIDMIVRSIVENVEKIDVSKLRRSDVQIIGMLKELITLSNNVVRKLMCLKEHKNIKISGASMWKEMGLHRDRSLYKHL